MRAITFTLICLLWSSVSFGQTYTEIGFSGFLKKYTDVLDHQRTSNFSVNTVSRMYKDIQNNELVSTEKGFIIQGSGTSQYFKGQGNEYIQNGDVRLEIDSLKQSVLALHPVNITGGKSNMEYLSQLDSTRYNFYVAEDKSYTYFKTVERFPISSNNELTLRFMKKTNDLSQINILYWPSDYYSNDLSDERKEQPRLVVDYTNYQIVEKANEKIQSELNRWISGTDKKYELTAEKKNYSYQDLRATAPSK